MGYIKTNYKPFDPHYNNVVFQASFEYGISGQSLRYSGDRTLGSVYDESKYMVQTSGKSMPYFYPDIGTGAYITSSDKIVGNNSLYITGNTSVVVDNSASGFANNFNFFTGAFTVEFWYKWPGNQGTSWQPVCGTRDNLGEGWHCGLKSSFGNYSIYFYNGLYSGPIEYWPGRFTTGSSSAYGNRFVTGAWNHLAFTRNTGVIRAFFNGELQQTTNNTTSYIVSNSSAKIGSFHIGGLPTINMYYSGFVDNIRITSGVARYTGNFNPPTDRFLNNYISTGNGVNIKWEDPNRKSKTAFQKTNIYLATGSDNTNRKITIK